jgi:outer membrane assembly lipoprotein YfiO
MQPTKKRGWFGRQWDRMFDPKNKKKTLRNMNFVELDAFKCKCLEQKDRYNAIRTLERMVPICTDLTKLKDILLELADLIFDDGKLESSGKMYREFVKYYPGNEKVEYALYKAVLCKYYTTLDPERDQSNTQETIELATKFLEREEIFTTHSQEVKNMRTQCYQRLLESEVKIFDFYFNRGRYKSARTRLTNIRKDFLPIIPSCDPYLITLEIQLAEKVKDTSLIEIKQKELTEKFPDYQPTQLAKADIPKYSNVRL